MAAIRARALAYSTSDGSGFGSGAVTINGGTVTATSGAATVTGAGIGGGGSLSGSGGGGTVAIATPAAVVASVGASYNKGADIGSGGGSGPSTALTPTGAAVYSLTVSAGANGLVTPSGKWTVTSPASLTFAFTPNSGYAVQQVTVNGAVISGAPTTYTATGLTQSTAIVVSFATTPSLAGAVAVNGTPEVGQTLTAVTSGITSATPLGTLSYQWLQNSVAISGATSATYRSTSADRGQQISVQVSAANYSGALTAAAVTIRPQA